MTAAELTAGLSALSDLNTALTAQLANVPADEAVLGDAVAIALPIVFPEAVPFEVMLPVAEQLVAALIANNKLHQQRLLPPSNRGSDPNLE